MYPFLLQCVESSMDSGLHGQFIEDGCETIIRTYQFLFSPV